MISSSFGDDFTSIKKFFAKADVVISKENYYVFIPTDDVDNQILVSLNKYSDTLISLGLKMKTGLTVDFRNKDLILNEENTDTIPLIYPQHIKSGRVIFPWGINNEYIKSTKKGLLQQNKNYLFVKRFTTKEETRRLQCGVYLSSKNKKYKYISTQNKVNFIDGLNELSECIVFGLYVIFNSTIYDRYYRLLNGSTQVNSTEINNMPIPELNTIEKMGQDILKIKNKTIDVCDEIIGRYIV